MLIFFADVISQASSGRRSAAYSGHTDRITMRQGSIISEKASMASGSLVSGILVIPEAGDATRLTPQQLGVMGESFHFFSIKKTLIGRIISIV